MFLLILSDQCCSVFVLCHSVKITQQKDFCFMAFTLCCNAVYIFLMYKCVSLCAPCFTVVNLERFD